MAENMKIWDAVSKTDPKHTKEVSFGRKFTSVNANAQIMEATRQFGPIGVGWGYDTVGHELIGDFFMAKVTLWHGNRENKFGPMLGCAQMFNVGKNKTSDSDAPKKAATDGLTKGLSQLGFNADIFLGMWDDNKYVQERKQEVAKESAPKPTPQERKDNMDKALKGCETAADLHKLWGGKNFAGAFKELDKRLQDQLQLTYDGMVEDFGWPS